jgi:hypothetical protein
LAWKTLKLSSLTTEAPIRPEYGVEYSTRAVSTWMQLQCKKGEMETPPLGSKSSSPGRTCLGPKMQYDMARTRSFNPSISGLAVPGLDRRAPAASQAPSRMFIGESSSNGQSLQEGNPSLPDQAGQRKIIQRMRPRRPFLFPSVSAICSLRSTAVEGTGGDGQVDATAVYFCFPRLRTLQFERVFLWTWRTPLRVHGSTACRWPARGMRCVSAQRRFQPDLQSLTM